MSDRYDPYYRGGPRSDTDGRAERRGDESARPQDNDTLEHRASGRRSHRSPAPATQTRGYWIEPGEDAAGRSERSRAPRRNARVLVWMVLSTVALAAVVIVAVLVFTGQTVVPGITARLYPIQYQEEIAKAAADYGQDPYLVAAMVRTESGYNAEAVSPVGAQGLMQLMPDTAEWVAGKLDTWDGGSGPDLTDPADNLELGVWYLDYLSDMYNGDMELTLAAYNAGHGNVDEWLAEAGGRDEFDVADIPFKETRDYVERVERYRALYLRVHPDAFE